ncbi:hypothetical protein LTR37_015915 [Vermiconidia calcicola]|uniref:Uncharacterized protein n=1 Tax=Vermiconidia calcicola TaxID=1690605 RepID=A0ACC3MP97_9PEZI|nr:hypothetical protein LTR37_015915 [Vermiconidia calcicola]
MNDESKAGRSTKSSVLGTAKIMSYDDFVEARAKRAEKDATKAKGKAVKRGRERKNAKPEAGPSQPAVKMARVK